MAKINVEVGVNTGPFQTGLAQMQNQTKRWKANFGGIIAGTFAGVGLASVLTGINKIVDKADQIQDLSDRFGVAAETLQRFGNVAVQNGSSFDAVGASFNKLITSSQSAINGNSSLQESFQRLGLKIEQLQTLSPEQQMFAIADAAKNSSNPTQTYADIVAVLGRNGGELVPALRQGADAIKEFGSVMSSKDVAEIAAAKDQLASFGNEALVLGSKILGTLVPALKMFGSVVKNVFTGNFDKIGSDLLAINAEKVKREAEANAIKVNPALLNGSDQEAINESKTLATTQQRENVEQQISTVKEKSSNIGLDAANDESKFTDEALNSRQDIVDLRQQELDIAQQINDVESQSTETASAAPAQAAVAAQQATRKAFEVKFHSIDENLLPDPVQKPAFEMLTIGGSQQSNSLPNLASQSGNPGPNIDAGLTNLGQKVNTQLEKQIGLQTQMVDHLAAIKTGVENIKLPEIGLAQFSS